MVMSTLLQLDSAAWAKNLNFTQYASAAAELLHASRDAIEALTCFAQLVFASTSFPSRPSASWLDFDAHPGDCACQIRPAAMHLIVCAFQSDSLKAQALLHDTLERLRRVEHSAKLAFHQLCTLNMTPSKIGSGLDRKKMSLHDFCYAIGAQDWFDLMREQHSWLVHSLLDPQLFDLFNGSACDAVSAIPATSSGHINSSLRGIERGYFDLSDQRSPDSADSSHAASSTSSLRPKLSPASSNNGDECSFRITPLSSPADSIIWNMDTTVLVQPKVQFHVDDWSFVVRWIVICFSLGRYRQVLPNKKSDGLVYRISVPPLMSAWKQMKLPLFIVLKTVTEHGYTIKYFRAGWRETTAEITPSIRDLAIEDIAPQQLDSDAAAKVLSLPHVVFYSQRVKLEQSGRLYKSSRCVEEMELEQEQGVPLSLLPTTRPLTEVGDDTEHLVQVLSEGGLHDMLLGFFAQHKEPKQLEAWALKQQEWINFSILHGCNYENASTMVPRHCFYGFPIELMRICEASIQSGSPLTVPGFLDARTAI
ncbi:uncharacterized protein UTRI_05169 [Ustilago trichophora]|uniref:Uncharacterized protein n=1 Tax=Ustilago trichophora TaxID=86804 RepID=A0A5C3EEF6_9BASI|nr:uncharacterized protein UTRI_05169 [Ustilago trichophora]